MARVSPIAQVDKKREGGRGGTLSPFLYRITTTVSISYGGFAQGFRDYGPPQQPRGIIDPRHDTSTRGYILNLFLPPSFPPIFRFRTVFSPYRETIEGIILFSRRIPSFAPANGSSKFTDKGLKPIPLHSLANNCIAYNQFHQLRISCLSLWNYTDYGKNSRISTM